VTSIRRLAPVEEGSRVQADAVQRLRDPLPQDEQPRPLDPDGAGGAGCAAQEKDAPRISHLFAQPGEEEPVRADRDHGHREPSSERRARVKGRGCEGTGEEIGPEVGTCVKVCK